MTDRELLEKAAKAACMWKEGFSLDDDDFPHFSTVHGFQLAWGKGWWNPLTDDGDALRLAVKLGLIGRFSYNGDDYEKTNKDPYAATRRAIVRAAAAIGESL